jgi:hypothetical protein
VTGGMFTSGLSATEFLLVRDAGFEPAGLVMGSSVCHLGLQPPVTSAVTDLHTLLRASGERGPYVLVGH